MAQATYQVEIRLVGYGNNYFENNSRGGRMQILREDGFENWVGITNSICVNTGQGSITGINQYLTSFNKPADSYPQIRIKLKTHHERLAGSDDCTPQYWPGQEGDLWGREEEYNINLSSIAPGIPTTLARMENIYNITRNNQPFNITAWIQLQVKYVLLPPTIPILKNADSLGVNICPNQLLTLKTKTNNFHSSVSLKWEYMISSSLEMIPNPEYCPEYSTPYGCGYWYQEPIDPGNGGGFPPVIDPVWIQMYCCDLPPYIPKGTWRTLTNTLPVNSPRADSIVFNPLADIFANNLLRNQTVYFRVKVLAGSNQTTWSPVMSLQFAAPPPNLPEVAQTTPSCIRSATGTISMSNIAGVGRYNYVLNTGYNNVLTHCDPAVQNCVGFSVASGSLNGSTLNLINLPAGEYTLMLSNPGDSVGNCMTYQNIKIDSIPELKLKIDTFSRTVSCFGTQDGYINLSSTGGKRTALTYTVKNTLTNVPLTNSTGQFSNLASGNYLVSVTDPCSQTSQELIVIGEPTRVSASPVINQPTCNAPHNGSLSVTARLGGGLYNYLLTKNSDTVRSTTWSSDTLWDVRNLTPGTYQLYVKNAERTNCPAYDTTFIINNPTPLSLSLVANTPVTCYGAANGELSFQAQGGQTAYLYYLVDTTTKQIISTSIDGQFHFVPAGVYRVTVKNIDLTCTDSISYSTPIVVTQPNEVQMIFNIQHITCKGNNNGAITLSGISGGSGALQYTWQQKLNGSWFDYTANGQGTGNALTNLYAGTFRLKVTSAQQCEKYSSELIVQEPAYDLILSSVTWSDIKCINQPTSIVPVAAGGYGAYTYYFTPSGGSPTLYNPLTYTFGAGTYTVKVRDSLGCEVTHPDPITITTPTVALAFTSTLSVYNGFNISCSGNLNGRITVTATGGNGGNYTGYQYALGNINGPYQNSNIFDSLGAGAKTIYVKDGRGCIVSQTVTLTQPTSIINATTTYTNPVCIYDSTGTITISASGGVLPYQYKIVKTGSPGAVWENWQSANTYSNLPAGQYTITIKDMNGCTRVTTRILSAKSAGPPLLVTKQHISCFNGNTGSINVTVNPDVALLKFPPFTYSWTGTTGTNPAVSSLTAGAYTIRVTDAFGCKKDSTIELTQPARIQTTLNSRPICTGSADGKLTFIVSGGTSPYTYSINSGGTYQPSNEFSNLTAGSYPIKIKDANNCVDSATAAVVTRNLGNTYVNFMVSSKQNAFDTVVVKEVCSPKPDSVKWVYDTAAYVIDQNQYSPRIRFNKSGSFKIRMTPYFGGCDLPMEKTVSIKPFDTTVVFNNPNIVGIDTVLIMPNPNTGAFSVQVKLLRQQKLDIYIRSITGSLLYYRHWNSVKEVMETINLNNNGPIPNGIYFLKVLTDNDARDKLIIKQ